jgi:hypothetical protein
MRFLLFVCVLIFMVSCATAKPQPEAFASAERAIEAAVRAGAEQSSPVELRFAREKLAEAHKGMEYRQFDKALYLVEQSEINSELAIEKSRTAEVRARLAEQARENEILREDFEQTFGESVP